MQKKEEREPHNVKALEQNISLVFRTEDISKLNKPTYKFIINQMHFIAHYDLYGFQDTYTDMEQFATALQTSEYSSDADHNLSWAHQYENDLDFNKWYGHAYCKSVADGIRRIVAVARAQSIQPPMFDLVEAKARS